MESTFLNVRHFGRNKTIKLSRQKFVTNGCFLDLCYKVRFFAHNAGRVVA